jgi:predicted enzyme related to lactoylglutathione lyase
MGKIIGLGGPFIKVKDPKGLAKWYEENLNISFNGSTYTVFPFTDSEGKPGAGYNVFSFFKSDSDYFSPSTSSVMINLRVEGLKSLLEELSAKGVQVVGDMIDEEYGKFGWILDLEGNKIELWEPPME